MPEKNPTDAPTQVTHYPTPGLRKLVGVAPPPPPAFASLGVHFDGATLLSLPSLVAADSAFLTFSLWFNCTIAEMVQWSCFASDGQINSDASYTVEVDSVGTGNFMGYVGPAAGGITGAVWHHLLASLKVDMAYPARVHQLYLDDVDVFSAETDDSTDPFLIDFMGQNVLVGAINLALSLAYTGDMAEFWFAPGQFIDFSVTANRRLFLSASGGPVDLGAAGATPTGTAAAVYLSRRSADPPSSFATNRGTGGAFTVTAGALTASATPPHL